MNYQSYEVSIDTGNGFKYIEVVSCDIQSAHADIRAAYGESVEIICTRVL